MIRKAGIDDYDSIVSLWIEAFGYDDFAKWFFNNVFDIENVLVYVADDKIVANLQRIPYEIEDFGMVTYIYGACTTFEYRNRGIMGELLEYSEMLDIELGKRAVILIPENKQLFSFYNKKGYDQIFYRYLMKDEGFINKGRLEPLFIKEDNIYIEDIDLNKIAIDNAIVHEMNSLYRKININNNFIIRNNKYIYNQISMYNGINGKVFIAKHNNILVGYAFGYIENGFNITELVYVNTMARNKIIEDLKRLFFSINILNELQGDKKIEYGCMKILQKELNVNKIIINLMYD